MLAWCVAAETRASWNEQQSPDTPFRQAAVSSHANVASDRRRDPSFGIRDDRPEIPVFMDIPTRGGPLASPLQLAQGAHDLLLVSVGPPSSPMVMPPQTARRGLTFFPANTGTATLLSSWVDLPSLSARLLGLILLTLMG